MKVYLDEDLAPTIAGILRQKGIDAISAHDVPNLHLDDQAQLTYAIAEGRAIVTANVGDFRRIALEAVAANKQHCGIVLVPSSFDGNEFQAIATGISDVLEQYPQGLTGTVIYIRRRRGC